MTDSMVGTTTAAIKIIIHLGGEAWRLLPNCHIRRGMNILVHSISRGEEELEEGGREEVIIPTMVRMLVLWGVYLNQHHCPPVVFRQLLPWEIVN
jgi:hypothetical protein